MSDSVGVVWSDDYLGYDLGGSHPLHPVRIDLTMRLARALGVLDVPHVGLHDPVPATDELLTRVHTPGYLEAVRAAPGHPGVGHGLGTSDNPVFDGMHEASALIAGGTVRAAELLWSGQVQHAVNVAGGLHHAMADRASGFCVYNDVAVAIAWLLDQGAERIAYVDVDVHHGDGVQAAFYDDPRVLTISLHETPLALFPGTGFPDETGRGEAVGGAVNVALPPYTGDAGWLRAFHAVVPGLLRAFRPQLLVTQCGCDSHRDDPLADLSLSVDGQRASYQALHALAHEICGGRWLATGGGGYGLVRTVPRAWTHLLAEAAGAPVDPATPVPEEWLDHLRTTRLPAMPSTEVPGITDPPERMGEGAPATYEPWGGDVTDAVDKALVATRHASYPLLDLDPADPRE